MIMLFQCQYSREERGREEEIHYINTCKWFVGIVLGGPGAGKRTQCEKTVDSLRF